MTIADRWFRAKKDKARAKQEMLDALEDAGAQVEAFSVDCHDGSIEVFGPVLKPDAATLNALRSAGFDRCWLHGPACQPPRGDGCRCQPHILSDEEEGRLARLHRRQQKRHTWVWTWNPTRRSPP